MGWEIEFTDEFGRWWNGLTADEQQAVTDRIDLLAAQGPALRRPTVGEISGSEHDPQMKELRADTATANLRILFIFDPRRTAILLVGGNKRGSWKRWYSETVPQADRLYREYLKELRDERHI